MDLKHVIGCSTVLLSHGISGFGWKIERITPDTPCRHDALALLEVVRHVGSVAFVPGMNVLGKSE